MKHFRKFCKIKDNGFDPGFDPLAKLYLQEDLAPAEVIYVLRKLQYEHKMINIKKMMFSRVTGPNVESSISLLNQQLEEVETCIDRTQLIIQQYQNYKCN